MMSQRTVAIYGRSAVALLVALFMSSCSGFFLGSHDIASLKISPTGPFVKPTATQQFTATATFGNNTMGDVTSTVTWTSSSNGIATIDSSGLATGVALGTTTIKAKSGSVSASTILTVANRTVTSITISPTNPTVSFSLGTNTQQFMATADFSDGSNNVDVTNQVNWTSSNQSVATIASNGLATVTATGTTNIGASYGGVNATTQLTAQ